MKHYLEKELRQLEKMLLTATVREAEMLYARKCEVEKQLAELNKPTHERAA